MASSDSWSRIAVAAASKRHQTSLQNQFDLCLGFEDMEIGDDDSRIEFPCPFCSEDFDVVGLCCHIDDEHPLEAKNGVCPLCTAKVGMDLVGHITMQHGNFFKMQRRRKFLRGSSGSHSALSFLKKELREGHLQSLLGGSSYMAPPLSAIQDPLLSSFIYNASPAVSEKDVESLPIDEESLDNKNAAQDAQESSQSSLSDKDQKERAQRSEFARQLLFSTIFPDNL